MHTTPQVCEGNHSHPAVKCAADQTLEQMIFGEVAVTARLT